VNSHPMLLLFTQNLLYILLFCFKILSTCLFAQTFFIFLPTFRYRRNSVLIRYFLRLKLSCDSRFQRAFTACVCVFILVTLVWANQGNYIENANACSKRTLKTIVVTQLKFHNRIVSVLFIKLQIWLITVLVYD